MSSVPHRLLQVPNPCRIYGVPGLSPATSRVGFVTEPHNPLIGHSVAVRIATERKNRHNSRSVRDIFATESANWVFLHSVTGFLSRNAKIGEFPYSLAITLRPESLQSQRFGGPAVVPAPRGHVTQSQNHGFMHSVTTKHATEHENRPSSSLRGKHCHHMVRQYASVIHIAQCRRNGIATVAAPATANQGGRNITRDARRTPHIEQVDGSASSPPLTRTMTDGTSEDNQVHPGTTILGTHRGIRWSPAGNPTGDHTEGRHMPADATNARRHGDERNANRKGRDGSAARPAANPLPGHYRTALRMKSRTNRTATVQMTG